MNAGTAARLRIRRHLVVGSVIAFIAATSPLILVEPAVADTNPINVSCTGSDAANAAALAQAFSTANSNASPSTIQLGAGCVFHVSLNQYGNTGAAALDWNGSQPLTIDGNGATIEPTAGNEQLLWNDGTLTVKSLTVTGGVGGVVNRNATSTLTINNSTVSENLGDGGVYNLGRATINASTIAGNSGLYGAGIYNGQNGVVTLNNSTVAGNTATDPAFNNGGGIFTGDNQFDNATTTIQNSTIVGNHAVANANTSTPGAGTAGIDNAFGTTTIQNTIVAENVLAGWSQPSDCNGISDGGGHNLSYPQDFGCPGAGGGNPQLGPLAFNGGPTETMALGTGSAAINAVPASGSGCPATDQRGVPRPQGSACDIGAYEFDATAPPAPTITTEPATLTNSSSASFAFNDSDATGNLYCQLDSTAYTACTSPQSYAGPLADGAHAFTVKAVDSLTNNSSTTTYNWTVDTVAPTVSLNAVATPTTNNSPTLSGTAGLASGDSTTVTVDVYSGGTPDFTADTPVQTLSATADGTSGAYSVPVTSPLADGVYTARASQSDTAGNTGISTATTFTVDTDQPAAPTISSPPSLMTKSTSASFTFSANDPDGVASYLCQLDTGSFSACTSPKTYGGPLSNGSHTFEVEAVDNAGNTGSAATYTWTVDTVAPTVSLNPPGTPTDSNTPALSGTGGRASGDSASVTVDIYSGGTPNYATDTPLESLPASVDPTTGAYSATVSPSLADGVYTARVSQSDGAGNVGYSASYPFTVDTDQPAAPTFDETPALVTNETIAFFVVESSDPDGAASFLCQLDGGAFTTCAGGDQQEYTGLSDGQHTVQVEAVDNAGNTGLAASYTWTVDTVAPVVSLNTVPNLSNDTTPTFTGTGGTAPGDASSVTVTVYPGSYPNFSATQPAETLDATVDPSTGVYSVTASPALADGVYTVRVTQMDGAGNTGAATPSAFTVDTAAPSVPTFTTEPALFSNSSSATFAFDTSDPVGIASTECNLDSAGFSSCYEGEQFTGLSDGPHTMAVEATDWAGNTSTSTTYSWTIITSTSVSISSITDPLNTTNDASATASGTATAGDSVTLTVSDGNTADNVTATTTAATDGTWTISGIDLSGLSGGTITWTAVSTDAAKNTDTATQTGSKAFFVGCAGTDAQNEAALAAAFDAANANPPSSTIDLGANCTFNISSSHWNSLTAFGTWDNLTIDGNGSTITRSAAAGTPDFALLFNGGNMTINGLTVSNGSVANPGGGIDNSGPSLTVTNSTFSNNISSAGNQGGGIYSNNSTLTISNSTIAGNTATSGGGIQVAGGSLTLTNSTVSGNTATGFDGGGIMVNPNSTATVTNSTLAGNTAEYFGAGIYNFSATVHLADSTVADNTTTGGGSGAGFYSGGGTADAQNTILANNVDTVNGARNCSGSITDLGYNISFPASDSSCPATFSQGDPRLGLLEFNGGPTQTIGLLPGSAAMDQIPATGAGCPATDQRGVTRPQGPACDIGAFESTGFASTSTAISSITPASSQVDLPYTVAGTVTPSTASGTVTVSDGTVSCNAPLAAGAFSCALASTTAGKKTITATYNGDAQDNSSSTMASYTVTAGPVLTYTGATSAIVGSKITLSATLMVNGAPLAGQAVTFSLVGPSVIATTTSAGVASVSTTAPTLAGTYPVNVTYAGNASNAPAATSSSLVVSAAQGTATKVAYTGTTSVGAGGAVTLSATLKTSSGKAISGRTVTFVLNGVPFSGTTNSSGIASSPAMAPTTTGSYSINVSFGGDTTYGASSTTATLVVKTAPSLSYTGPHTAVHGSTVVLSATLTVSGTPLAGKTVTFTFNGKKYTAVTNGSGVASVTAPTPKKTGTVSLAMAFAGDAADAAASATATLTIT